MGDIGQSHDANHSNVAKESRILHTFDEVICERAEDGEQVPLIAYPRSIGGVDDYEFFTGKDLNTFVDGAVKVMLELGVAPVYGDDVAAIYGPSTLDYIVTVFALGRLGYTTFILSPRLPASACVSLLQTCKTTHLLHAPQYATLAATIAQTLDSPSSITTIPILTRTQYDSPAHHLTAPFLRLNVDPVIESSKILILMHSSGSTGLPKPIDYRHKRLFATFRTAQHLTAFQSVPLFHAHGFISFIQGIYVRKCVFLWNGLVPQTNGTVTRAIKGAVSKVRDEQGKVVERPAEVVWTVPYVLKLLCEGGREGQGVQVLKQSKLVSCSGSKTPDELGDLLVSEGINFGTVFGATEVALILTSLNRPPGDTAWNYLRPPPHIAPFIHMRPLPLQSPSLPPHEVVHECIVLDGHVGKMKSNSNDPYPNCYHTSDLFIPHPMIKNAWKPVGRLDDRITLLNGEKVLPLSIEGRIVQHKLVREAAVFGVDREVPGLLLFRGDNARGLTDAQFLTEVWPTIEHANSHAESFSQISQSMIVILPEGIDYPVTDKSSIKRAAVYHDFAHLVDDAYARLESSQEGILDLNQEQLEAWIIGKFSDVGIELSSREDDFFSKGVNSLMAIQMRGTIVKSLNLGGNAAKCPSLVVYDGQNAKGLAAFLIQLKTGLSQDEVKDEMAEMEELIAKFSVSETSMNRSTKKEDTSVLLLTGSTGTLGSHILSRLVLESSITTIICPVRTSPKQTPQSRLTSSLKAQNFSHLSTSPKIRPVSIDPSNPTLHIPDSLISKITHIIHCSWSVNFALPLSSFIPQLQTLQQLVQLSLATSAHLLFCSSVGVAMSTPISTSQTTTTIQEHPIPDLRHASPTGYARSKLVAERILEIASTQYDARVSILRIGQIIPPLVDGEGSKLWNPNEMIPLLIRSTNVIGCLPDTISSRGDGGNCDWIDVGTLSRCVVEIAGFEASNDDKKSRRKKLVYNLVSPRKFSWAKEFLPRLKEAGLKFEVVTRGEWLKRLGESDGNVATNPSRKLLGFWQAQDGIGGAGGENIGREIVFDTVGTEVICPSLRHMGSIVDGDYVRRLLSAWKDIW